MVRTGDGRCGGFFFIQKPVLVEAVRGYYVDKV